MTESKKRRFYGRRVGRKLRPARLAFMDELLPKLAFDLTPDLSPPSLFSEPKTEYWLEIGFGGGEHLVWRAENNPSIGMIGSEVFINGIATLLSEIDKRKLTNIRIYPKDARDLIFALEAQSIARCFLLFPDPWPKRRHRNRRFISRENLDQVARLMKPGGEFIMATDDPICLLWMLHHMQEHPAFLWQAARPSDWRMRDWPITRYERKAAKAGRQAYFLSYRRVG